MASTECQRISSIERTVEEEQLTVIESLYDIPKPLMTHRTFNEPLSPTLTQPHEFKVTVVDPKVTVDDLFGVSTFFAQKPVIADVKIFKPEAVGSKRTTKLLSPPEVKENSCWSAEALDRLDILSDLRDEDFNFRFRNRTSTFVNPSNPQAKQSVYIDLGEYQTLLGHNRLDEEEEEGEEDGGGSRVPYTLPQPLSYGDDTMKAVQNVTQKFDSFRMRQMRARSFRESGTYSRRRSSNCSDGGEGGRRESSSSSRGEGGGSSRDLLSTKAVAEFNSFTCNIDGVLLSERDIYRIEVFYRGGGAVVHVCPCLADVFLGATTKSNDETHPWVQIHTGVPVLLLNTGEGLRPRELIVLVVQRDTALPLWQDKVNYLSTYHESSPGIHSMKVSGSLTKSVQLRMMDIEAAKNFLEKFHEMTSDPDDELWKISADKTKVKAKAKHSDKRTTTQKKQKGSSSRRRVFTKADISQPCNSTRLTTVDVRDLNFRSAFGDVLPAVKEFIKSTGNTNEATDQEFRPRLPTK